MRRSLLVTFALAYSLAALLAVVGPPIAAAVTPSWATIPLTSDAHGHGGPQVSGGRVAWWGNVDGPAGAQIFTQRVGADFAPIRLTNDYAGESGLQVSGDRLVWTGNSADHPIFTFKVGLNLSPIVIKSDPDSLSDLHVSDDRVVWREGSGTDLRLFAQSLGADLSPVEIPFPNSDDMPGYLQVSGNRVAWEEYDLYNVPQETWAIYTQAFRPSGSVVDKLCEDTLWVKSDVHLSGSRVVWVGNDGSHSQVFTEKAEVDGSPTQLTTDTVVVDSLSPQVSGDRVVWQGDVLGWNGVGLTLNWQIYTRKIGLDSSPVALTHGLGDHTNPQVSGDRVAWLGNDGTHDQVFTQKVGVEAAPVQLTFDAHGHKDLQVSGDLVVWTGNNGSHDQIFLGRPIVTPSLTRSPNKSTITVKRKKKVAKYKLSASLRDPGGAPLASVRVYLQTSKSGKTKWKNSYPLVTSPSGAASGAFSAKKAGTIYYRWYAPATLGYNAAYSGRQKVHVK